MWTATVVANRVGSMFVYPPNMALVRWLKVKGTLTSNDADGNENVEKNRFNTENNNFPRASHFLCISFPFLHDYEVKLPTIAFYGDRKQATTKLTTPENTIIYHNVLFCHPKFCVSIVFNFSWELKWPQEKLKTMLMQILGWQTKSIMACYDIFWSGQFYFSFWT